MSTLTRAVGGLLNLGNPSLHSDAPFTLTITARTSIAGEFGVQHDGDAIMVITRNTVQRIRLIRAGKQPASHCEA
jgi:hypothetical protein